MKDTIINGIHYRKNEAGQLIAQRFEIHRMLGSKRISTLTGGQAMAIITRGLKEYTPAPITRSEGV